MFDGRPKIFLSLTPSYIYIYIYARVSLMKTLKNFYFISCRHFMELQNIMNDMVC